VNRKAGSGRVAEISGTAGFRIRTPKEGSMIVSNDHRRRTRIALLAFLPLAIASVAGAQAASSQKNADPDRAIKLGILPFADATASGNRTAGADVARTMLSEVVHSTTLQPRMLVMDGTAKIDDLDADKAIVLGRDQHVDLVFVGTVLEARTQESNKSGWIPSIKGQSANVNVRRVKATVTLQGELYDVASGRRLFSERVTGNDSNTAVGGTSYTTFGSWGSDSYRNFLDSPLGKALQTALTDMTKKVVAARRGATH
jgi:hypothetical protein